MTIQELAKRANVTTRTIRYYVEQGLLPPPGRGRVAEYTDEHLRKLELIRTLKEQYLPLEEIRRVVSGLDMQQLEELVARHAAQPRPSEPGTSAAEYVAAVLARSGQREPAGRAAPLPPQTGPAIPSFAPPPPPVAAPPAAPAFAPAPARGGYRSPPAVQGPRRQPTTEGESTWRRVPLAPGFELHYMQTNDEGQKRLVERLVAALMSAASVVLEDTPEKAE